MLLPPLQMKKLRHRWLRRLLQIMKPTVQSRHPGSWLASALGVLCPPSLFSVATAAAPQQDYRGGGQGTLFSQEVAHLGHTHIGHSARPELRFLVCGVCCAHHILALTAHLAAWLSPPPGPLPVTAKGTHPGCSWGTGSLGALWLAQVNSQRGLAPFQEWQQAPIPRGVQVGAKRCFLRTTQHPMESGSACFQSLFQAWTLSEA